MSHLLFSFLALALSLAPIASGVVSTCYKRELSIVGWDFFQEFTWFTEDDPTHGRVNYLSLEESKGKNLTYATEDKFFMFPDSKTTIDSNSTSRGRDSNRIFSNWAFDESVIILDLEHMPHGCATWPAFWSYSQMSAWPTGGEIDIIEGVNQATQNLISLHTLPNCAMPEERLQTGKTNSTDCDTSFNYNQGCGTQVLQPDSYGEDFNSKRGGFYALARSKEDGIKVWFWPRDGRVPDDVGYNGDTVDPDLWGTPAAYFPTGVNCEYEKHFDAHMLVFDLTFCGDFAGASTVWEASSCSSMTCSDFVDKNPDIFANAYWEVNSLRIYIPGVER